MFFYSRGTQFVGPRRFDLQTSKQRQQIQKKSKKKKCLIVLRLQVCPARLSCSVKDNLAGCWREDTPNGPTRHLKQVRRQPFFRDHDACHYKSVDRSVFSIGPFSCAYLFDTNQKKKLIDPPSGDFVDFSSAPLFVSRSRAISEGKLNLAKERSVKKKKTFQFP